MSTQIKHNINKWLGEIYAKAERPKLNAVDLREIKHERQMIQTIADRKISAIDQIIKTHELVE
tara:strand:+ start:859 stop:1047 length:189 start_codon:yes stop_codon:yes gene_type:complete